MMKRITVDEKYRELEKKYKNSNSKLSNHFLNRLEIIKELELYNGDSYSRFAKYEKEKINEFLEEQEKQKEVKKEKPIRL